MYSENLLKIFTISILLGLASTSLAQSDSLISISQRTLGIVTGCGYNGNATAEIAFGIQEWRTLNDTNAFNTQTQVLLGNEFFFHPKELIFAPKLTFLFGINTFEKIGLLIPPMTSGFSLLYPNNSTGSSFCLRLEFGIPFKQGRLYYGYSIPLCNKNFMNELRHQLSYSWYFRVSKKHQTKIYFNKEEDFFYEKDQILSRN